MDVRFSLRGTDFVCVGAGTNLLSFGRFQNVDGIGAGLGWFQR